MRGKYFILFAIILVNCEDFDRNAEERRYRRGRLTMREMCSNKDHSTLENAIRIEECDFIHFEKYSLRSRTRLYCEHLHGTDPVQRLEYYCRHNDQINIFKKVNNCTNHELEHEGCPDDDYHYNATMRARRLSRCRTQSSGRGKSSYYNCIEKAIKLNMTGVDHLIDFSMNISQQLSRISYEFCEVDIEGNEHVIAEGWRCSQSMGLFDVATEAICQDKAFLESRWSQYLQRRIGMLGNAARARLLCERQNMVADEAYYCLFGLTEEDGRDASRLAKRDPPLKRIESQNFADLKLYNCFKKALNQTDTNS